MIACRKGGRCVRKTAAGEADYGVVVWVQGTQQQFYACQANTIESDFMWKWRNVVVKHGDGVRVEQYKVF